MALIQKTGGIDAFVDYIQNKHSLVTSRRSALMLSYVIGVIIFVESTITALISGAVGKPLCDRYKIPYAKLAYVCDSTSAPISSLIVLNGWGALLLGLISTQIEMGSISGNGVDILIDAVFYNFYALSALVVTFLAIWFNIDLGYMKKVRYKPSIITTATTSNSNKFYMIIPIFLMVFLVFFFLYLTGDGDILNGSGSSSIFYTMLSVWVFLFFYYVGSGTIDAKSWIKTSYSGAKSLIPIVVVLLLAFAIGEVTTRLKTGLYLASLFGDGFDVLYLASAIFLLSCIISFSTGTSWGTFSIMIPIAVPMAVGMDADVALCIGAVISGGVFGDHCSPISDTTIISSMASGCEIIEHVKSQIPYAILSGIISFILFIVFSIG
ncbi:MAG: sodium:proton antiporter [Campylobacterales bacterium]|nr:sodium:proton antiporter [Campylobacterales bacterium]